jgi:hypothetical protein
LAKRGWGNRPSVWPLIGLGLAVYILASSVLGLILPLLLATYPPGGPVAVFVGTWSTSIVADAVFVIGSVASAIAGVLVAKRSKLGSLTLAAVLTWLTYTITAAFIVGPMGMPGEGGSPPPGADDPYRGIVILVAPLFGAVGLIFAAIAPTVAHGYLVRFLAEEPTAEPGTRVP